MSISRGAGGRSTRQWMLWAFKLHGCADCGRRYPEIPLDELHCDHRDPTTKLIAVGRGMQAQAGLQRHNTNAELLAELVKCDVVCAECHRKRHRAGRNGAAYVQGVLFTGTGEAWRRA